MEIHATIHQKVNIDPIRVIDKLIGEAIGHRGWISKKDGKFYKGYERSAGSHSIDCEDEISEHDFNYVSALQVIKNELERGLKRS